MAPVVKYYVLAALICMVTINIIKVSEAESPPEEEEPCPPLCRMECEYGFVRDDNGCELCECAECPSCYYVCVLNKYNPDPKCERCGCEPPPVPGPVFPDESSYSEDSD